MSGRSAWTSRSASFPFVAEESERIVVVLRHENSGGSARGWGADHFRTSEEIHPVCVSEADAAARGRLLPARGGGTPGLHTAGCSRGPK